MKNFRSRGQLFAWALLTILFVTTVANATSNKREVNVVDLVANSDSFSAAPLPT